MLCRLLKAGIFNPPHRYTPQEVCANLQCQSNIPKYVQIPLATIDTNSILATDEIHLEHQKLDQQYMHCQPPVVASPARSFWSFSKEMQRSFNGRICVWLSGHFNSANFPKSISHDITFNGFHVPCIEI